ncbi:DUF1254 domain-containing protein [Mycobacterium sp. 48b]|uniref:DUF1254 domain-containing protein n=1 Tax=Mycobacterium sp. 48b TaxID=3400426 RepID=UPI003AACD29A
MPEPIHGWLTTETLSTSYGDFRFEGGYPAGDTGTRLLRQLKLNRAIEVYLTQMMPVSQIAVREGLRAFGATSPQQIVIWEQLMDSRTVLLTANAETVYAIALLDLKADGPTVIEAPPHMLGFIQDGIQRYVMDVGMLGPDKGAGGKFLVLPPGYDGEVPDGYFAARSPTYSAMFAIRGFQSDGSTERAIALMEQAKVYPLARADSQPKTVFINGSRRHIDTLFPDTARFFDLLAMLVEEEPAEIFGPLERFQMQAIGIIKGTRFAPDDDTRELLNEAARIGGAMARANTYGSLDVYFYPDKQWQGITSVPYTFNFDGVPQIDIRNNVYYMAAGNSPAMMDKNVGQGSQYLWTYRDADGDYLQGDNDYRLHIEPGIPAMNFWSVVVYDALSRSQLQTSQPLPSVSTYTEPEVNADGSIDIMFASKPPAGQFNWIQTVPGRGFFAMFRFYSPTEAFFDKTWQLDDIRRCSS